MTHAGRHLVAVLAIGSELLDGRTLECNSNFLCTELHARGVAVRYSLQVGDALDEILSALRFLAEQHIGIVLVSGGLGPTVDDRTRAAIARFCGTELERDPAMVAHLEAWFASRGRSCSVSNLQQADKPRGASWIPNAFGTAPGFCVQRDGADSAMTILTFPGIPRELRGMFAAEALPLLSAMLPFAAPIEHQFRIFGLPESVVNDRVKTVAIPETVEVIFNVDFPVIAVVLRTDSSGEGAFPDLVATVRTAIESQYIFTERAGEDHAAALVSLLEQSDKTIALAESCTGGVAGGLITAVPGCSRVFRGGVISYSNQAKVELLGVSKETLMSEGAVSELVALEMVQGVRSRFSSDYAVSITGIAGPAGGTESKPVGTVWIGFASAERAFARQYAMPFDRERFRRLAAFTALEIVRRELLGITDE